MSVVKRMSRDGYDASNMTERVSKIVKHSASWRHVDRLSIITCTLHQVFTHTSGATSTIKHICPWGMRQVMGRLFRNRRCLNPKVLNNVIKTEHPTF